MRLKIILLLVLSFTGLALAAQDTSSRNAGFYNLIELGVINGKDESALSIQGALGVRFNKTLIGAGIGVDHYRFRSIPVFLQVKQEVGNQHKRYFVYANSGYNMDWVSDKEKEFSFFNNREDFKGGFYYDAGIGIRLSFIKTGSLLFSGGYSGKKISKETKTVSCPLDTNCLTYIDKTAYSFRRLVFRVGWEF